MAQLVELEEVCLHAVIFEMRRDYAAARVVGRVLHGAEVLDLHVLRDDDESAGVLARGTLDAHQAHCETALLRLRYLQPALLEILEHIAVGRLFRQRAYRACAENVVGAEEFFSVLVSPGLVFAREVQVDIRHLVAAEAQEGLKGDVEALLAHLGAALGAILVGHVRAAAEARAGLEVRVVAVRADVVRRERVDLRNAGHVGHDGRADAASAADKVAVSVRIRDKLLGRHVNDVVVPGEDVAQLGLDTLFHDVRRVLAVYFGHAAVDQVLQNLRRVLDFRREEAVGQELDILAHVRYLVRVPDNSVVAGSLAEIGEFLEHVVGRAEVERVFAVGVRELLGGL